MAHDELSDCRGRDRCERDGCQRCCWCRIWLGPSLMHDFGRALFYVCKAMGPPRFVGMVGDCWMTGQTYVCMRDPEQSASWWRWFDEARAWAEQ